jgi:hypothetical protein
MFKWRNTPKSEFTSTWQFQKKYYANNNPTTQLYYTQYEYRSSSPPMRILIPKTQLTMNCDGKTFFSTACCAGETITEQTESELLFSCHFSFVQGKLPELLLKHSFHYTGDIANQMSILEASCQSDPAPIVSIVACKSR